MKTVHVLLALPLLVSLVLVRQGRPAGVSSGVRVTDLKIDVRVVDGIATTMLRETLRNEGPRQAEADWILPLPEGAVADEFRMTIDGVQVSGEVLGADRARDVYETIVRRLRDPGLLEFMGRGCLRARVFPIPPQSEVLVEVGYRQVLPEVAGVRRWSFPIAAAGVEGRAPEQVVLDLSITSRRPIRNAFSPLSALQVITKGDHEVRASFEGRPDALLERELAVLYGLSEKEFGLDLFSTAVTGEQEGAFLMLISPKRDRTGAPPIPKSITFVLDTSGSMAGRKIEQARGALRFFLSSLRAGDRFNVVPFATEAEPFFAAAVEATAEHVAKALKKVDQIEATGGTNIVQALGTALRTSGSEVHVPIVVFLTDGRPTIEEKNPARILNRVGEWNAERSRIFVFGVGNDIHTGFLDTLAGDNGGTRNYVCENEDIEVKTSDLFGKLSRPVLTDLELSVEGVELKSVVPARLPDLFAGGRLVVLGRYRGEGPQAIRLTGSVAGQRRQYVYEGDFAQDPVKDFDFVPSLWAERRVAMLLDEIRLNGVDDELIGEVRRLGSQYRIVTPYTSHLIVEEGLQLGAADMRRSGASPAPGSPGGASAPGTPATGSSRYRSGGGGGGGGGAPGSPGPARPGSPAARAQSPTLDQIAERLSDSGVLPRDATKEDLRSLARTVADEIRTAERALRGLGRETTGRTAVDDSAYLARLLDTSEMVTGSDEFFLGTGKKKNLAALLLRFTRKVGDKVFVLREGVWIDRALRDPESAPQKVEPVVLEAYSQPYFALLRAKPKLAPYFAFSERLAVVYEGVVYEVRAPQVEEDREESP